VTTYRVPIVLWVVALTGVVLTLVASVGNWPAQFGTDGSSPETVLDWFLSGSALSAPIGSLVVVALVGLLATRDGVAGMIGDGLAVVVTGFLLIGSLAETFAPDPVTAPRAVLIVSGVIGVTFAGFIIWAVIRDVRVRRALRRLEPTRP
jgi:hypothetical protein